MNKIKKDEAERLSRLLRDTESFDDKADDFFTADSRLHHKQKEDSNPDSEIDIVQTLRVAINTVVNKSYRLYKKEIHPRALVLIHKTTPKIKEVIVKVGPVKWSIAIVTILFFTFGFTLFSSSTKDNPSVQGVSTGEVAVPTFETIEAPNNNTKFDSDKKVASYEDEIAGSKIVVSQQQVPDEEKSNGLFLLKVAQAFNIQKEFQSDKVDVFIGENQEQQVQTAIFRYKELLVFIQTETIYQNQVLLDYINEL